MFKLIKVALFLLTHLVYDSASSSIRNGIAPNTNEHLLLIGGTRLVNIEPNDLIPMPGSPNCSSVVPRLPVTMKHGVGFTLGNKVFVCGGVQDIQGYDEEAELNAISDNCYKYDAAAKLWTLMPHVMQQKRTQFSGVPLNKTHVLFIGGNNNTAVEVFDGAQSVHWGASPTFGTASCAVKINTTHLFVAGGSVNPKRATVLRIDTMQTILELDTDTERISHSCGLVKKSNEDEIVITGGHTDLHFRPLYSDYAEGLASTDILNLTTMQFRSGPDFPNHIKNAAKVQLPNSFLVTGGEGIFINYQPQRDVVREFVDGDWVERTELKMTRQRSQHMAMMVKGEMVGCV